MPQMHDATHAAGVAGTQLHRCVKGHPLNPVSMAAWQEGWSVPRTQSFSQVRKCKICKHDIPRNWVRLGCEKGCQDSVCLNLNCAAKVLDSAKRELAVKHRTVAELETALLEEESLLVKEAAVDSLRELGTSAQSATPILEKLMLKEISHKDDRFQGTSSSRNSIRHTFLANDGTHPLLEYQGCRAFRVKVAVTLALLRETRVLEDALLGDDPDVAGRPEVREAAILGLAELGVQGRGSEAAHLIERLGLALSDEVETVRIAAAHALRCIAPAGVTEAAAPFLVEALRDSEENYNMAPESMGGMPIRKWQDAEGRRLFELDLVAALSCLGASANAAAEPLASRLASTKQTSAMRWAAAEALAQSGALEELRKATEHCHRPGKTDILHPRPKPQSTSVIEEVRRAAQTTLERISVK